jgi:hypothetical protein
MAALSQFYVDFFSQLPGSFFYCIAMWFSLLMENLFKFFNEWHKPKTKNRWIKVERLILKKINLYDVDFFKIYVATQSDVYRHQISVSTFFCWIKSF